MSRYLIDPLTSRDLNEIADYFLATNPEAGNVFFDNLSVSADN